ncbi:MAG: hypothetical protein ABI890_00845 [Lapillicoccus sp.]
MTLPGLDILTRIDPDFARKAQRLGLAAWHGTGRPPRETAAAFLGCDLALGLLDLPLTLHATMARSLHVSDAYLTDIMVKLAPDVGYPTVAQALVRLAPATPGEPDPATQDETALARAAAAAVLGEPDALLHRVAEIVAEYGNLHRPR